MTKYNFDKIIDRQKTDSLRWSHYAKSVIPLWVADMDFESPDCVIRAMKNRVNHGIYGYPSEPKDFKKNIVGYIKKYYDWEIEENWIVIIPSVVSVLYSIATNCTKNTSHIVTPKPVYHHLRLAAEQSKRDFDEAELETIDNRQVLTLKGLKKAVNNNS